MASDPATSLLIIGDREALAWVLTEGRTAFPANRARVAGQLTAGDKLLLYTTRGCFHNPGRDQSRVIGEATVLGPALPLDEPVSFGGRTFPVGCDLRIDSLAPRGLGVEMAPLVAQLDVFSVKASWSVYLRRPTLPLGEHDAKLVRKKLKKVVMKPSEAIDGYLKLTRVGAIRADR